MIERPVDGQSGILGDIRPACSCAHVIPAGKQLSGAVVLAVWRMKATFRQMWALEAGRVERDLGVCEHAYSDQRWEAFV